jgi:hypothetical protein
MDETAVIQRLRALGRDEIDPEVASTHLQLIASAGPAGVRPRNLVAAAVAFALLAGGAVAALARDDDPGPSRRQGPSSVTLDSSVVVDDDGQPGVEDPDSGP